MQQKYRFVGTELAVGDRVLKKLGEVILLTPEQRKEIGINRPLVHDSLFSKIGFTDQELSLYGYSGQRHNAPEPFLTKLKAAWQLIGEEPTPLRQEGK